MKRITIYKREPEFIVGGVINLLKLKNKIEKDTLKMGEIEELFNTNQDKYKKGYYKAKINYLDNYVLYNWLLLEKYYGEAMVSDAFNTTNYTKKELIKKGWLLPQFFVNKRFTFRRDVSMEENYIDLLDSSFDFFFNINIGMKNSRVDRFYHQAIFNYNNKNYYSCAVSLFPIIESYHQAINKFDKDEFYKIKENLLKMKNEVEKISGPYSNQTNYYIDLVEKLNSLIEKNYFCISLNRKEEPEIINRHRIMHGIFTREISKIDCLQLFCAISNLYTIDEILSANESIRVSKKEIEELEKLVYCK